ncbi:MFS multidrug transporter [Xylaria cubensis]|nr:MFS multidrug transporter [Xylaria cubensis]
MQSTELKIGGSFEQPVETGQANSPFDSTQGMEKETNKPSISVWSSADDPRRPRSWSLNLEIKYPYQWILVNSSLLLGIGLSSLFLAPLSEQYGRKPILLAGMIFSLAWNTGCGAARTLEQIIALRILTGFGASVGDAVGPGVLSDIWKAELRGRAFAVYIAAPLLGTAIGPIFGVYVSVALGWHWVFWITSLSSVATILVTKVFLLETYEPRIERSLQPFRLLGTQLSLQLLAIYMGLLYDILWLFLFIYPLLWADRYNQEPRMASLNYLSFGIGLVVGVNIAGHLSDYIYSFVFGTGVYVCSACVCIYTIDTYTKYAASAISTNLVLRSVAAAFFPIFAPYKFDRAGFCFGATVLASSFLVIGLGIMCLLWFFGERLRGLSPYCATADADMDLDSDTPVRSRQAV